MVVPLPHYYDPAAGLLSSTTKNKNPRAINVEKRIRWTKNYLPLTVVKPKYEAINEFTTTKRETGSTKVKSKNNDKSKVNDNFVKKEKQKTVNNSNSNKSLNKNNNERTRPNEIVSVPKEVYDTSAFLLWYSKVNVAQNHQYSKTNRSGSTITCYAKNYYDPISDKNTNSTQAVEATSRSTNIGEDTRLRVKKENKNCCGININETNMPEVQRPQYNIPDLSVTDEELLNRINGPTQEEENWKMVNQKEIEKEIRATHETTSTRFLPRNIPEKSIDEKLQPKETKFVIALYIKMGVPKNSRATFKKSRILVSVLKSLQNVYPDTYIGPSVDDKVIKNIYHPKDIPLEDGMISQYLQTPVNPKSGPFIGKIFIHCNHTLQDELDDINPKNLGFLENVIPRHDTIHIHTMRLSKLLPPGSPKFQLNIQTLYAKSGERARAVMIKCDDKHYDILQQELEKLNVNKQINYFPWNEFLLLSQGQRLTVVARINVWRVKYRSLLINGFIDHDDNIPMIYDNTQDPQDPMTKMVVTDYLKEKVMISEDNPMFVHVYPPIEGTREVIVTEKNCGQATSYIKVAHGELAKRMDSHAIRRVFQDPDMAIIESGKQDWKPIMRPHTIECTISSKRVPYKKRSKTDPNTPNSTSGYTAKTYSTATSGITGTTASTQVPPSNLPVERNQDMVSKAEFETFKNSILAEMNDQLKMVKMAVVKNLETSEMNMNNQITSIRAEVQSSNNNLIEANKKEANSTLQAIAEMIARSEAKSDANFRMLFNRENCKEIVFSDLSRIEQSDIQNETMQYDTNESVIVEHVMNNQNSQLITQTHIYQAEIPETQPRLN
jgi:hypothetical protein